MFGKQLEVHVVDNPHRDTFKNGNRKWKFIPTQLKFRNVKNEDKSEGDKAARVKGLLAKEKEKRDRLRELGLDYEFEGYRGIVEAVREVVGKEAKDEVKTEKAKKK